MISLNLTITRFCRVALIILVSASQGLTSSDAQAWDVTLEEALDMAINRSARGGMIKGREEVAEQNYNARRINFYLPEISINGNVPAFSNDQSYRFFGGAQDKSLYETRDLNFNSFIELKQSVPISGGSFVVTANLTRADSRYPDTRFQSAQDRFVDENSRRGFFDFSLEQQLFRPSAAKYELHNKEDDLDIARMNRYEQQAALKKEVIEAYVSVLQLSVKRELYMDKLESATIKSSIDSMKLQDGIVSEEDFLLSTSDALDAELESSEIETQSEEQRRELAMLLDVSVTEQLVPLEPEITDHIDKAVQSRLVAAWEQSVPIHKARREYSKAERIADYAAAGHGLIGDLKAHYSMGSQKIETERYDGDTGGMVTSDDDINTAGWGITLEFRLPLWDGGAGSAAVKAARFEAEQARLECERETKKARAEIINLVNQIDVGYRRLEIMRKQIELAGNKLDIAQMRLEDGQISQLTFLESRIFYLEMRSKYFEELKQYLVNRVELEGKFIG